MSDSDNGNKTPKTPPKTPVLMRPISEGRMEGTPKKPSKVQRAAELYRRRVTSKNQSSGNPPLEAEADDTPHYFTNGPGDVLVPLEELQAPDRDQSYQIIRLYHVDGITWAVCDDCALERFPRAFEGSKVVARVGCAHCRCQNALADEALLNRWLVLGRPPINLAFPPRGT